jgi:hypothetical protein
MQRLRGRHRDASVPARADPVSFARRQVWPGNNSFCCGGLVIAGPGSANVLGTVALIATPVCLFVFRVAVFLSDVHPWTRWVAAPIVVVLGSVSLASLAAAHCMDPVRARMQLHMRAGAHAARALSNCSPTSRWLITRVPAVGAGAHVGDHPAPQR